MTQVGRKQVASLPEALCFKDFRPMPARDSNPEPTLGDRQLGMSRRDDTRVTRRRSVPRQDDAKQ
jgi:hypothetical protein